MLENYLNLGEQYYQQENWQDSLLNYQKALKIQPDLGFVYHQIGEIYRQQKQWQNAIASYKQAIEINPNFAWSHLALGDMLVQFHQWKNAFNAYRQAVELEPNSYWTHHRFAEACTQLGEWEQAITAYRRSAELELDFVWNYYFLGNAYLQLKQWQNAIIAYEQAIKIQPDLFYSYENLGYANLKLNQWDTALTYYDQALQLNPNLSPPHNYIRAHLHYFKKCPLQVQVSPNIKSSIKVFRADPCTYTIISASENLAYLKLTVNQLQQQGIEFTNDPNEANVILSQYIDILETFIEVYGNTKTYLVYTEEPRWDINFEKKVKYQDVDIHIMNVYTRDIFINNYCYCLWRFNQVIPLNRDHNFSAIKQKKIAALITKRGESTLKRDGVNIDLNALRIEIALTGYYLGKIEIYGKRWEDNISLEDSRYIQHWGQRKFDILKNYHFNLCFENTIAPYYCTEKIWDAIFCGCLPIYYGGKDSTIYEDFPPHSFIDYCEFESPLELLNYIDNMEFKDYQERLNLCIKTFNQFVVTSQQNGYFLKPRVDNLAQKIITCVTDE